MDLRIRARRGNLSGEFRRAGGHEQKLVIMLHGGPGGSKVGPGELFVELAEALAEHGFSSLRFDFWGSGQSDGRPEEATLQSQTEDIEAVFEWAASRGIADIAIVGESLGATVAMRGIASSVKALVLLWPAVDLPKTDLSEYLSAECVSQAKKVGFLEAGGTRIGWPFLVECLTADVTGKLKEISIPTLIIHGEADRSVPVEQARSVYRLLQGRKQLVIIADADHGMKRPLEQEAVKCQVVSWFRQHL